MRYQLTEAEADMRDDAIHEAQARADAEIVAQALRTVRRAGFYVTDDCKPQFRQDCGDVYVEITILVPV